MSFELFRLNLRTGAFDASLLRRQSAPFGDAVRLINVQKHEAYVVIEDTDPEVLVRSIAGATAYQSLGSFDTRAFGTPTRRDEKIGPATPPKNKAGRSMITPPDEKIGPG